MKVIDKELLEKTIAAARASPRRRHTTEISTHPDVVQRLVNAIEPDSYVRPHKHFDPDKTETFLILRGKMLVVIFDDNGKIKESHLIEEEGEKLAVDIPPATWHMAISLKSGSVLFEVKEGPYIPNTDKNWAPWAPKERTAEGQRYLAEIRKKVMGIRC